jgi:hypothetical protein
MIQRIGEYGGMPDTTTTKQPTISVGCFLFQKSHSQGVWKLLSPMASARNQGMPSPLRGFNLRGAQRSAERLHRRMRRDLSKIDEHLDATLAFSGRPE